MMFARGLRLFYDLPSTRGRALGALLLADQLLFLAPLFLVVAAPSRPQALSDALYLVLWGTIPRHLAQCFAWLEKPREILKAFFLSAVLVIFLTFLMLAGWNLVYASQAAGAPVGLGTAAMTVVAWSSGFLLFQPRTYRLYDFLCGSVMLLGLLEGKREAWLWVPLFFIALFFSSCLRHLVHDVSPLKPKIPPNLQNVRILAGLGAISAIVLFFSIHLAVHGGFAFPAPPAGPEEAGGARPRLSTSFIAREGPPVFEALSPAPAEGGAAGEFGQVEEPPRAEGRRFGYRVLLEGVARKPRDQRLALVVKRQAPPDPAPAGALGSDSGLWPPRRNALWRGATCSVFDPEAQAWTEEAPLPAQNWPAGGRISLSSSPDQSSGRNPGKSRLVLEHRLELPFGRSLITLHQGLGFAAKGLDSFRLGTAEGVLDVFPGSPLPQGFRYEATASPVYPGEHPQVPVHGAHPDGKRTLRLPASASLGLDVEALRQEVFPGPAASIQAKIAALRRFFIQRGFQYSRQRPWKGSGYPLREFLLKEKIGNCTYYATAGALLLRSAGVSTRIAVGFLGGEWDPGSKEVYLRLSMAHAWVEVYFPGHGWLPLDPTAWVPNPLQEPTDPQKSLPPPLEASSRGPSPAGARDHPLDPGETASARRGRSDPTSRAERWERAFRKAPAKGTAEKAPDPSSQPGEEDGLGDWFQFGEGDGGEAPGFQEATPRFSSLDRELESTGQGRASGPRKGRAAGMPGEGQEPERRPGRPFDQVLKAFLAAASILVALLLYRTFRRPAQPPPGSPEDVDPDGEGDAGDPLEPDLLAEGFSSDPADLRHALIAGYHRLQRDLRRTRSHRLPHQTPLEHARQFSRDPEIYQAWLPVIRLLYRALYGIGEIARGDVETFEKNCNKIRRYLA
ncbi:MAG: hypothetical protein HY717_20215 [Planctomycetes bacterium]|nr:hypothetical protein [Planctomycetota bacterium]